MALVSPIKLSDEEKLEILQRFDQFRQWHSLEEKRYCLVCGEIITGLEIQMIGGTRGNGPLRIICPTENWPTAEVLIKIAMVEAERRRLRLIIRAGRATQYDQQNEAKPSLG
jgi:hypothetical protein